ncbi:MAG TPA: Glu/Leu/Phe/Val dehydrogenase dimerization domain-containing protein, partial [Ohtaekwangia sp.]|nr:Glu/Leu/Phe/Val dehydrogenase dimerization domain-containing protein [Ohtaekwangia sp.]
MMVKQLEKVDETGLFGKLTQSGHEQVVFCSDPGTGLKAIIAIHNTILGPALGGTRMWHYTNEEEALSDVLRLSRGMTFKAAISGVNLGGGKAVIIGDAKTIKSEALLRRFGKFVDSLNGKYITAEDVNMKTSDMEFIRMETRHVTGLPESMGGGGDPSPVTAYGVYMGMKAGAKKVFGSDSLAGKKIAVQGVGQVGMHLIEHLIREDADVVVTDMFPEKVKDVVSRFNVKAVDMEEIYDIDMDIFAPCALGGSVNS